MKAATKIRSVLLVIAVLASGSWIAVRLSNKEIDAPEVHTKPSVVQLSEALVAQNEDRLANSSAVAHQNETSDDAAYREWKKKIAEELALHSDPDSLTTAALMLYALRSSPEDKSSLPRVLSLLERAAESAPKDASIQVLLMSFCSEQPKCDPARFETALQTIEPKNAIGWIGAALRAISGQNEDAVKIALDNMARCDAFASHNIENTARMIRALDSVRVPPPASIKSADYLQMRNEAVHDSIVKAPFPPTFPLIDICSRQQESLRTSCADIGETMQHADFFLAQLAGDSLAKNSVLPNSPAAEKVAISSTQFSWLRSAMTRVPNMQPNDWVRLQLSSSSETEAIQRWIAEHDLPTEPPASWRKQPHP